LTNTAAPILAPGLLLQASLSGSQWGKALLGQRAQRIEMLLLHEFYGKKFLLPDKLSNKVRGIWHQMAPLEFGWLPLNASPLPLLSVLLREDRLWLLHGQRHALGAALLEQTSGQ